MKNQQLINEKIINTLSSPIKTKGEALSILNSANIMGQQPDENLYTLINRKHYVIEAAEALNSSNNLIYISGFQGSGKTTLLKTITSLKDNHGLCFYYECSQITNLDDIILSLYRDLHKFLAKDADFKKTLKNSSVQSIDEKLINCLKNLKRPLIICLDGFENLIDDSFEMQDEELAHFLNFIISLKTIKLIIAGRKVPLSQLKTDKESLVQIRLAGLDEEDAYNLFKDNDINASEHTLYQGYQMARGYPESIHLLVKIIKNFKISIFDLIKEYSTRKEGFEEYIIKKVYTHTHPGRKKLLWLLSVMRHPIRISSIKELNLVQNADETIAALHDSMLIAINNDHCYIKQEVKRVILDAIPVTDRIKIHEFLHDLYSDQIAKKVDERLFKISRKLLHSEQYYHYVSSNRMKKDSGSIEQKIKYGTPDMYGYGTKSNKNDDIDRDEVKKYNSKNTLANEVYSQSMYTPSIELGEKIQNMEIEHEVDISLSAEEQKLLELEVQPEEATIVQHYEPISIELEFQPEDFHREKSVEEVRHEFLSNAKEMKTQQKFDLALINYKKAFESSEKTTDIKTTAIIGQEIGELLYQLRDYNQAIKYLNDALETFTVLKDKRQMEKAKLQIGNIYSDTYKHDSALKFYFELISPANANISKDTKINAYIGIADIYEYRDELKPALKYYAEALSMAETSDDMQSMATLYFKIALIYDDLQDYKNALKFYEKNTEFNKDSTINPYLAAAYSNLGAIYEEKDEKENAIKYYKASLNCDEEINNTEDQFKTLSKIANIYLSMGNNNKALEFYKKEIQTAKETRDPYCIATAYLETGDFYFAVKNYEKALKFFIFARKVIGKTISTDSKEKIDRRFRQVMNRIGAAKFDEIVYSLKKKDGQVE